MKYVCADIHGCYDRFIKMLSQINFQDTDELYILGDVIDRNEGGIKILLYLMEHTNNMHLFMGNHEKFMYDYLTKQRRNKDLGLSEDTEYRDIWFAPCNGGVVTYDNYKQLDEVIQHKIYDYLGTLSLIMLIEENGIKYHLSHSGTIRDVLTKAVWYYNDCTEHNRDRIVWNSLYRDDCYMFIESYPEDYICIFGHVPVQRIHHNWDKVVVEKYKNTIDIDGGCAYYSDDSVATALIVYTLGTDEIQYVV